MNDFISQLNQNQSATSTLLNTVGKRDSSKNDRGADFSALVTKASGRGKNGAFPASKKTEDIKPAEELVAYAAASQAANNPAQTNNSSSDASSQEVAAVTETTAVTDVQDTPVTTAGVLAPVLGADETKQLLEMLGDDVQELDAMLAVTDENALPAEELFSKLVEVIDGRITEETANTIQNEEISDIAQVYQAPVQTVDNLNAVEAETPTHVQEIASVAEDTGVANNGAKVGTEVNTDIKTDVTGNDVTTDAKIDTSTEVKPEVKVNTTANSTDNNEAVTSDNKQPVLPIEKADIHVLHGVRAKIAAHIAAQSVKNNDITEETAAVAEEALPVAETEADTNAVFEAKPVETAEVVPVVNAEGEQAETDDKSDSKEAGGHIDSHFAAQRTDDRPVSHTAFTEHTQQVDAKVNTQNIIDQIVQSARMTKSDGLSQLEIQLRPEHLGKVSIVLTSGEDGVTAHIKTQNDTVRAMLGGGLGDLMTSLKEMGVNMKNIEIGKPEMSWDYTRNAGNQHFDGNNGNNGRHGDNEQPGRRSRILSVNNPRLSQLSNTLYGAATLKPLMDENMSVDFIA